MSEKRVADADAFLQWKGIDVCLDFRCYKCETFSHFDGDFAYFLECGHCGQIYALPSVVALKAVTREFAEGVNGCIQIVPAIYRGSGERDTNVGVQTMREGEHTYVGEGRP